MKGSFRTHVGFVCVIVGFWVGTASGFTVLPGLQGNDLTDLNDDGDETLYVNPPVDEADYAGFDAEFFSSDGPGFTWISGELAFNVFDNLAGGSVNKWCCSPVQNHVGARILSGPHVLTAFTLTSSNDTPARDPRVWEIQGSNDGINYTTIYRHDNPSSSIWGNTRNQTIRFSVADGDTFLVTDESFGYFRLETFQTGGNAFALSELEFFGIPNLPPTITELDGDQLSYPVLSGPLVLDQGSPAVVVDPLQASNGWSGATIHMDVVVGGESAEDVLSVGALPASASLIGGTNGQPLTVTFNIGATSNDVESVVRDLTYENTSATPTPGTRVIEIVLMDGDGLAAEVVTTTVRLDLGGLVTTYVWDGTGDGTSFSSPSNWEGDSGVPDANDIAVFRTATGTGTGQIDLGGGTVFVGEIRFDGAGSFVLFNGLLSTDRMVQEVSASGTNQVSAAIASGVFEGVVSGGTLSPLAALNETQLAGGTWRVDVGSTLVKTGGGSLGQTEVILNGGELMFALAVPVINGRFVQVVNNGETSRQLHIGELEVFDPATIPAVDNAAGSGSLNPGQDLAAGGVTIHEKGAVSNFVNDHGGDDDARLVDAAENTAGSVFGISGVGAYVTVDLLSEVTIGRIRLHQRNDGCCQNRLRDFTVNIFSDNGGQPGNLLSSSRFPGQPSNNGFAELFPETDPIENPVTLLADSVISISSGVAASLGNLQVENAVSLDVRALGTNSLDFVGTATLNGDLTLSQTGMPTVVMNNVGGSGGIILDGDGTLELPTQNTYAGETLVQRGILVTGDDEALGATVLGTLIEEGGALQPGSGIYGEPLMLSGTGVVGRVDGAFNKQAGGTIQWLAPIQVEGLTRIYSQGGTSFFDGGIDLSAASTLNIVAANRIEVRTIGFTGDSDSRLEFEGNNVCVLRASSPGFLGDIDVINDGRVEAVNNGVLGDNAGVTRVLGGESTLRLFNGYTQVEDFIIEGNGRGTEGAIYNFNGANTLVGTISLSNATEIVVNSASQLTIDGSIVGGQDLLQRAAGTLVLTQDNDIRMFDANGGATTRIEAINALGSISNHTVDVAETLELSGGLLLDDSGNLKELISNNGTISSFVGTNTVALPLLSVDALPFRFGGGGTLIVESMLSDSSAVNSNELIKSGAGDLVLPHANTYGGNTFVSQGTLHVMDDEALGRNTADLIVQDSGTLTLHGGIDLVRNEVFATGLGAASQLGAIVSDGGTNSLGATSINAIGVSEGELRVAATMDRLTLNGPVNMQFSTLSVDGNGDIVVSGEIDGAGGDFVPSARFVQIQKNISGLLHIGEVEVFAPGTGPDNDNNAGGNNVPLNNPDDIALSSKTASIFSASTAGGHGVPEAVIDGLEQTGATTWTKQQNGGEATAQITIDLGGLFDIDVVRVHQRNEQCCQERLENFTINLYDDNAGVPGSLIASDVFLGRPPVASFGEVAFFAENDNRILKLGEGTLTLNAQSGFSDGGECLGGTLLVNGNMDLSPVNNLRVAGSTLGGTGAITGVTIDLLGVVRPGPGVGRLSATPIQFSGPTSVLEVELGGTGVGQSDQLFVDGGVANLGNAILDLRLVSAYVPAVGDRIEILSGQTGTVNETFYGLPDGAPVSAQGEEFTIEYLLDDVFLNATGNRRLYAGRDMVARVTTNPVTVAADVLTANDSIGVGTGPLSVLTVETNGVNGGVVGFSGGMITYTPPGSAQDTDDAFTYTVSDGTHIATGLVTVVSTTAPEGDPAMADLSDLGVTPSGDYQVAFMGTPGVAYRVEWTQNLASQPVTWTSLGSIIADSSGELSIVHVMPPEGYVVYRAVLE